MNDPGASKPAWRSDAASASEDAELLRLREAIDRVDRELLDALNRRAALVREVGARKGATGGGSIYRPGRERDLVEALIRENPGPFPSEALPAVFREIISASRALEAQLTVAYLGPEGTSSFVAAREAFGSQVALVPVATLADVIEAVSRGEADHALLPIENTSEGVVTQALDQLLTAGVPLCGERWLRISYQLVAQRDGLDGVKRVASHPQALAQCRGWLDRELPNAARVETSSTAVAAALAREQADVGAIVNADVEVEGLVTPASGIEDRRDNTTRFLILGGEASAASGNDLTMLAFTVRKAESGALHRLLEPFARHGVNLTSIQARPLKGAPWEYVFFLDLEGHWSEPAVQAAYEEAGRVANSSRILGSFPRAREARREGSR
ncbi:MAG: bifunctional chorismate mutase/prephenate dehydratase [Myxococcota bacterium]